MPFAGARRSLQAPPLPQPSIPVATPVQVPPNVAKPPAVTTVQTPPLRQPTIPVTTPVQVPPSVAQPPAVTTLPQPPLPRQPVVVSGTTSTTTTHSPGGTPVQIATPPTVTVVATSTTPMPPATTGTGANTPLAVTTTGIGSHPDSTSVPIILVTKPGLDRPPRKPGTQVAIPGPDDTHVIVVHQPPETRPVTSGAVDARFPYSIEFIEPGVLNRWVEVYRSKDAKQATYRDANPMSDGGFHFIVIGIRNPEYSH